MAVWTEFVGIFEDKGGWVAGGDPDLIDLTDFVGGEGVDYLILKIRSEGGSDNPDLAIKALLNRLTGSFGQGKKMVTDELQCWVRRTAASTEKEKYNLIRQFIDGHMKLTDPVIYLVKRGDLGGVWKYEQWPNQAGTMKKYLQGKVAPGRYKQTKYGVRDFTLIFTQVVL